MGVLVTYETGATLTYHLTAYSPWERYRVMFNGSGGRIELEVEETQWTQPRAASTSSTGVLHGESIPRNAGAVRLCVRPICAPPREIDISPYHGGHGGADDGCLDSSFPVEIAQFVDADDQCLQATEFDGPEGGLPVHSSSTAIVATR